jgi:hypothetical protein
MRQPIARGASFVAFPARTLRQRTWDSLGAVEKSVRPVAVLEMVLAQVVTRIVGGRNASPFVVFPRSPSGKGTGDRVPADPSSPPCVRRTLDTTGWTDSSPRIVSTRIRSLEVRVPPDLKSREETAIAEGAGNHWEHMLASWHADPAPGTTPAQSKQLAFWIGPHAGYPTIGATPGTRQLDFAECHDSVDDRVLRIAEFALRPPFGPVTWNVAACWDLGDDVFVTAIGTAPDEAARLQLTEAIRSARIR